MNANDNDAGLINYEVRLNDPRMAPSKSVASSWRMLMLRRRVGRTTKAPHTGLGLSGA